MAVECLQRPDGYLVAGYAVPASYRDDAPAAPVQAGHGQPLGVDDVAELVDMHTAYMRQRDRLERRGPCRVPEDLRATHRDLSIRLPGQCIAQICAGTGLECRRRCPAR